MGEGGGPSGPTAAETKTQMKSHWESYQKWGHDATKSFESKTASMKARMSAGGVKAGSPQWGTNLGKLQGDYEQDIKALEGGTTAGILRDWVGKEQGPKHFVSLSKAPRAAVPDAEKLGMTDYLTKQFGTVSGAETTTRAKQATQKASEAGRGSAAAGATPEASRSPWW